MSTACFMSRLCKRSSRSLLAILVGSLLAVGGLLPSVALARTSTANDALSSTSQSTYLRDKVGVSLVRLIATYGVASNKHLMCTGLGVLVASKALPGTSLYQNWILTDGNLVKANMSACGLSGGSMPLRDVQIWESDEYAHRTSGFSSLDSLTNCSSQQGPLTCEDASGPLSGSREDVLSQGSYTLFSFQSSVGEPHLLLNLTGSKGDTTLIGLTNRVGTASGGVFPYVDVDGSESPPAASPQTYLMPDTVVQTPGKSGASTTMNAVEAGTPIVDPHGELLGLFVSEGKSAYTPQQAFLPTAGLGLPAATTASSPNDCTDGSHLAACWNAGIDAYYGAPSLKTPQYSLAASYFNPIRTLNPAFLAPQTFAVLAEQHQPSTPHATTASPDATNGSVSSWLLLIGLGGALLVLILMLILVTLLAGRARRRRRELERFAAEQLEARRIAEAEVQRQRVQPAPPPPPEAACPNCHQPVHLSDAMCPHCRFPLAPSASGLNVRLVGNAPLPPSAAMLSEQPTVPFPPNAAPASYGNGDGNETTARRQQAIAEQATVQNLRDWPRRKLNLAVSALSDRGLKRKQKPNEDSLFAMQGSRMHDSEAQQFGLLVVADGMGGHANGQDASRQAIQSMIDFMLPRVANSEPLDDDGFLRLMGDGVQQANQAVHNRNLETRADMGTTMTAALVIDSTAYVANVGDSRTYLYREGQGLSKVTNDHSVVASLVEAGIIQPDDIYTHPKRNQIYRSLGEKPVVEVDTFRVDLLPGDKLLLCSDGLWDMVRDPLIQQVVGKSVSDPSKTSQELIKAALAGGGEDNVSVIIAQFAEMKKPSGQTGIQLLAKPESVTVPNLPPM